MRIGRFVLRPPTKKALVVDDDAVWRQAILRILYTRGIAASVAPDFQRAQSLLDPSFDLVVSEVIVRHEACFPFLALVRNVIPCASLIAISDRAPRPLVFRLREFGVDSYLEKPISSPSLHRCLDALEPGVALRLPVRQAADPSGGMELDVHSLRVHCHLTGAEVDVLRGALKGLNRDEIAFERGRSLNTIKTLVRSLLSKTGTTSIRALVRQLRASNSPSRVHGREQRA